MQFRVMPFIIGAAVGAALAMWMAKSTSPKAGGMVS